MPARPGYRYNAAAISTGNSPWGRVLVAVDRRSTVTMRVRLRTPLIDKGQDRLSGVRKDGP